ncbi:MAG: galactokinase family protein [Pseudomonadota bacterium]
MSVTASAPGSVMIIGEHAVVQGAPALVAAIDQRARVTVKKRADRQVVFTSEIASPLETSLDDLRVAGPYRFLAAALKAFEPEHGVDVKTQSDIDPTLGLGSSAAITIAALGAFARLYERPIDVHSCALGIVRAIQGRGSGADLAASFRGGVVRYQLGEAGAPAHLSPVPWPYELSLKYVGYKTPTGEVLEKVARAAAAQPQRYETLYREMAELSAFACDAAQRHERAAFARALDGYQILMARLGVSEPALDALVEEARAGGADAAKISGSGLGDCVLAFGARPPGFAPAPLAQKGLLIDA